MQESEHIPDWSLVQQYMRASPSIFFYWLAEADWPVKYVSENISRLGYSAEEFIAGRKKFSEIVHPEDLDRVAQEVEEYTARKLKSFTQEYRVLTGEGEVCWIDDRTVIQCNAEGEVTHYLGIVTDITKEKNAETALKLSQEKYRTLVETTKDFVWEVDRNGIYTYCSPQVESLLGYRPEEMLGKTPFEFMTAEDIETVAGKFSEVAGKEQAFSFLENTNLHRDGREIVLETSGVPFFDADGKLAGYRGIDRDITERKRADERQRLAASVFENTTEGILVTDVQGTIQFVNPAFTTITQYESGEAIGKNPRILQSRRQDHEFYQSMWSSILEFGHWQGEIYNRRKNGEIFPQWLTISAIKDNLGNTTNYVGVTWDITERKQAEEDAQRHQRDMAHVMRLSTMGEMATGMAHELNQPLAAIVVYCGTAASLVSSLPSPPQQLGEMLERAKEQAHRAGDIIRHLREFVSKEGKDKEPFDLDQVIRDVITLLKWEVQESGIKIDLRPGGQTRKVSANKIQIEQVLINLVRNSLEAIGQAEIAAGRVVIQTRLLPNDMIEVSVSDNGPGVDATMADKIFDQFQTSKETGMGIGLSLSRTIIEAHGGNLWVDKDRQNGALFVFELPVSE
jgi:PAS domain S-box-containing protein